jgi:hypothetical protein
MPAEDIPSMLQMIEEKIASSEIEVQRRHTLIRLRHILEEDLQVAEDQPLAPEVDRQPGVASLKVQANRSASSLDT